MVKLTRGSRIERADAVSLLDRIKKVKERFANAKRKEDDVSILVSIDRGSRTLARGGVRINHSNTHSTSIPLHFLHLST